MAADRPRRAADLLVDCLAAEGCEYVFSVPGEETMDILDALSRHEAVRHITTRHEQGAAFMADVHGRLTGRAAVAMATLGPGATNLVTGIADAYLDRAPMVAITGQAASGKLHKEAHQVVDIVRMFEPVTKWNTRVERIRAIPEIVRKAFRVATLEKPGPTHIELPEDLAATASRRGTAAGRLCRSPRTRLLPRADRRGHRPRGPPDRRVRAADHPGRQRRPPPRSAPELRALARGLHVPVAATFMGKGAIDDRSHLSLMAVGLQARDHVLSGFDRADLVVCVGYDLVEYAPSSWNPDGSPSGSSTSTRSRPRSMPPTSPRSSSSATSTGHCAGCWRRSCRMGVGGRDASERHESREILVHADLRPSFSTSSPPTLRTTAGRSPRSGRSSTCDGRSARRTSSCRDVGAHKIWVARLYQAYEPNTVIISNGFAAMGIAIPGAIAAKLVHPDRKVVALCGDGGFLMNSQELETAGAIGANITRGHLARRRLRTHRLEAAQRVRSAVRGRVRQPGLRALRGVVRDRRLPTVERRGPVPDVDARPRGRWAVGRRGARSTTPRTCG